MNLLMNIETRKMLFTSVRGSLQEEGSVKGDNAGFCDFSILFSVKTCYSVLMKSLNTRVRL